MAQKSGPGQGLPASPFSAQLSGLRATNFPGYSVMPYLCRPKQPTWVSCIIWTLTLQTTVKYVAITLRADNNGEGGIFSLYALIRRHAKWTVLFTMIGGAALLADGLIIPTITVTSAIEGLNLLRYPTLKIVQIKNILPINASIVASDGTTFHGSWRAR